jgi:hypothetical protein
MQELPIPSRCSRQAAWLLGAALIVWTAAALGGWYMMAAYGFGVDAKALAGVPDRWPASSSLTLDGQRDTLALFIHPRCPCSRATVAELERLQSLVSPEALPAIRVVASEPRDADGRWSSSPLTLRASRLPNATVERDPGGVESALFAVRVSGTVLLFDQHGERLYAGGVTMARGHDGHNAGLQAVVDLLSDRPVRSTIIPPFGCTIYREDLEPAADSRRRDFDGATGEGAPG